MNSLETCLKYIDLPSNLKATPGSAGSSFLTFDIKGEISGAINTITFSYFHGSKELDIAESMEDIKRHFKYLYSINQISCKSVGIVQLKDEVG